MVGGVAKLQTARFRRSLSSPSADVTIVWDGADVLAVNWSNGTIENWSISSTQPAIERFPDGVALRLGSMRLWAIDENTGSIVEGWINDASSADEGSDDGKVQHVSMVPEEDIRRFAGLLASGAITLKEFCTLSGLRHGSLEEDVIGDDEPSAGLSDEEWRLLEEYRGAFLRTWPDMEDKVSVQFQQDGTGLAESAVPQALDPSYAKRQLDSDYSTFIHLTTTAGGLLRAYVTVAPELMPKTRIKPLKGLIGFVPLLQNMNTAAQLDAADQKFLKKLEKELSREYVSEETQMVRDRTKEWFRRRQAPIRSFAERIGWNGLTFI